MIYITLVLSSIVFILSHYQFIKTRKEKKYGLLTYFSLIILSSSIIGLLINKINILILLIIEFILLTITAIIYMKDWFI